MFRIGSILVAVLLFSASAAVAATPRDGRFAGPTSQKTKPANMDFKIAREGKVIRVITFPSVAGCGRKAKLRITTLVKQPVKLVVGSRIKLSGSFRGTLGKGSTYRAFFRMDGRFPTRTSARGTWGLRAVVRNRRGRVTARCRTGGVGWRAARL
ncbi:MAG: hypothetical protein WKF32_04975 [Thermoleophilaceae bacterium]